VKRALPDGFELDDDVRRVDRAAVHDFICNHSYWAAGRGRERQDELIDRSARVVGLYLDGRQVGFTRTVSDGHVAYLADVYVLPEFRGRGLGVELVRESVDRGAPTPAAAGFCTRRTRTSSTAGSASPRRPRG
jgi:ribosomal protein S18 acetylase RimI-like enzyme